MDTGTAVGTIFPPMLVASARGFVVRVTFISGTVTYACYSIDLISARVKTKSEK